MRALTVQQPWAWSIVHGGKDVENRTQAWSYRGPLAIHAGARLSERGCMAVPDLLDATQPEKVAEYALADLAYGAIIGVVELVDVHVSHAPDPTSSAPQQPACCDSPWAETSYDEHGGRTRRDVVHLVLEDPRPLAEPVPCRGMLGLWTPPLDVLAQIAAEVTP
ncbi:ASCH domain-containing protein [Nocardioides alkalitolerans]|uniref:ASCH domain-containing protein n=1 Tax=Nocardioides alkalitolerans TaxID=281714 RepID=UPI00048D17E1|nr:ASCH domain-containing protein [Nocardioides alkalitolerans]